MIKTICKIGDAQGILIDSALLEFARLKVGDAVNIEVHSGGVITITPLVSLPPKTEVSRLIKETMNRYEESMKRLT